MRRTAILVLLVSLSLSAATPKKKPVATIAPPDIPHPIAQFLRSLCKDGGRAVTFKASATGTHFFFEEASGVTVYRYVDGKYVRETFLAGAKLPAVVKRYAKK
ncbi:MAG: hypothetical protein ACJ74H_02505 [Thermoanaerobaculia bacterium]